MQQAVAPCPEIVMSIKGKPTRSLLDSGSEVTLVNESYYREHIEHRLVPSSGSYNNSHNLFSLRGVEEGHIPLSKHFECDIEVGGQLVHRVGILVKKDKIPLVHSKGRKAKTPALLGSNLIRIAVNEFCELLVRIAFDYSNALRELALYGSLHSACTITPTFIKNLG